MTGAERKRLWRLRNPERSRAAERNRAKARRRQTYSLVLGESPRPCASSESYWRYEQSMTRFWQRHWYRHLGPGSHRLSPSDRAAAIEAEFVRRRAAFDAQIAAFFEQPATPYARSTDK